MRDCYFYHDPLMGCVEHTPTIYQSGIATMTNELMKSRADPRNMGLGRICNARGMTRL